MLRHILTMYTPRENCSSVLRSCLILVRHDVISNLRQNHHGLSPQHLRLTGGGLGPARPPPPLPSSFGRFGLLPNLRSFHTSSPHLVNPVFFLVIKSLVKVASIITGRTARRAFQRLPEEQKKLWRKRIRISLPYIFGGVLGLGATNYVLHIQETPITKRKRYIAFTPEQFMKIAQYEYELQWETVKNQVVNVTHPHYKRMERVTNKIINANQDLAFFKKQKWTLILVDSEDRNAFVLPTGHIFVYTGLMDTVQNEDQLAVVLGHEMAHAVLMHGAERMSLANFVDYLVILTLGALWFVVPNDGIAVVTHWFFNKVVALLLSLPYDRKLENEADDVGLELIAKACYDVRESCNFWDLMRFLNETEDNETEIPQMFSTHPSNETRIARLAAMLPKALNTRQACHCPQLSDRDPRVVLQHMKSVILEREALENKQRSTEKETLGAPQVA